MAIDNNYDTIDKCRISNSELINILHMSEQPLANSLKNNQKNYEDKFPLSISFCEESSLVQLNETINKEILFDQYVWVTGTSKTTQSYANTFTD